MRILLTGGTGFIGSHFVEHVLSTTDHELVVLDSLSYAGDVSRLTDQDGYDPKRVKVLWHDLRSPIQSGLRERIGPIDVVVNMASESHVDNSIADPVPFINNNVAVATTMLEYARHGDTRPGVFIQVSTDEVYGAAPTGYSHHEWDPIVPSNPYSASKAAQEAIAIAYWRTYGVPVVLTNTMNNFGERQHPEKFLPIVVRNLTRGKPVPVHQGGSRVWLHARNHADALLWLMDQPVSYYDGGDGSRPDRWNVAGDRDLLNETVVEMAAEALGVEPAMEYVDFHGTRPGHDRRYSLEGSKLKDAGWKPPVTFEESFERCVRWMSKHQQWL